MSIDVESKVLRTSAGQSDPVELKKWADALAEIKRKGREADVKCEVVRGALLMDGPLPF